jgi:hypothetical protein
MSDGSMPELFHHFALNLIEKIGDTDMHITHIQIQIIKTDL